MKLLPATLSDFDFFYEMKCEDFNVYWTGHANKPNRDSLYEFYRQCVENFNISENRKIYIVWNEENQRVGHVYIIPDGDQFDLPIAIKQEFGGKGYAKKAIMLGLELGKGLGFNRMEGSIREDNIASMKAFSSCGVMISEKYLIQYNPQLKEQIKMFIVYKDF